MKHRLWSTFILFISAVICNIAVADGLPLPDAPASLKTPAERAAYIVEHFWNAMDFADTIKSRNTEFIEQCFVNYLNLFPHTPEDAIKEAIPKLINQAKADTIAYNMIADFADKYLYDPESPMFDEESYIIFLEAVTGDTFMESVRRERFVYELADAMKNRKGGKANDFNFTDSHGEKTSLYGLGDGKQRIVLFYDPDCDHCRETINEIKNSNVINGMLESGKISILAIYAEGDNSVWELAKTSLPQEWINGYSPNDEIEQNEIYVLRRAPTLYLLDSDNTVLLKDTTVDSIIKCISKP